MSNLNEEKDVASDSSTEKEQAVTQEVQETASVDSAQTEQNSLDAETKPAVSSNSVDETGVPWQNRAMEWKRKTEELSQALPNIIEQKLQEVLNKQQVQTEKKYSISELESFALQNPEYKPWVEEQKAKVIQENLSSQFDEKLKRVKEQEQALVRKQQAEAYVVQNYPDAFLKDSTGRVVGWDQNSPITREIMSVMQDQRISGQPDGLQIASDIAYARYMRSEVSKSSKTQRTLKSQVRKLEQATLAEGQGKAPVETKSGLKKAQERLAQTGTMTDAQNAVKEYFKGLGVLR